MRHFDIASRHWRAHCPSAQARRARARARCPRGTWALTVVAAKLSRSWRSMGACPVHRLGTPQTRIHMRTIIRSAFVLGALFAAPVIAIADPDTKQDAKDKATDA